LKHNHKNNLFLKKNMTRTSPTTTPLPLPVSLILLLLASTLPTPVPILPAPAVASAFAIGGMTGPAVAATVPRSRRRSRVRSSSRDDADDGCGDDDQERLKSEFAALLRSIAGGTHPPEELPGLLARNVDVVMGVLGAGGGGNARRGGGEDGVVIAENDDDEDEGGEGRVLLEEIVAEEAARIVATDGDGDGDGEGLERISEAVDVVLSFAESFAPAAGEADAVHKSLLRKIFESISPGGGGGHRDHDHGDGGSSPPAAAATTTRPTPSEMEERLDGLLDAERGACTPGFLRHVEGEVGRLSSLPTQSAETSGMVQVLRLIQARVLEELGKDIGEGAIVLGQLLGYDDDSERSAVLDAGLAVRGMGFARELAGLTGEALEDFAAMTTSTSSSTLSGEGGGADGAVVSAAVDPELVRRVGSIDGRIRAYIGGRDELDFQ
jgi:hypothetical protein